MEHEQFVIQTESGEDNWIDWSFKPSPVEAYSRIHELCTERPYRKWRVVERTIVDRIVRPEKI